MAWSASVEECNYALPLIQGETINFFFNYALDNTVDPYTGLLCGLWSDNLGIYLPNVMPIAKLTTHPSLGANEYKVYSQSPWTVPLVPKNETFRFVLYYAPSDIRYYSNPFKYKFNTNYTVEVKYRNESNDMEYIYDTGGLLTFQNTFRVDCRAGRPTFNENVSGYDTYEGGFIQTKSDIQKSRQFQTRHLDEVVHDGWFSMLANSYFTIDALRYKKAQDQSYDIEWSEFDDNKIGNGMVNLLIDDYSSAVINCS
jgi:hypothetical protein